MGLCLLPTLWGRTPLEAPARPAANKYIGAKKCKNCHDAEASGNQWGSWQHAGHAKAFETLSSAKAKEIGKQRGIADPSKSEKCLKCHVTAFGAPKKEFKKSFKQEDGVGCETCHGMGNNHARARFRAANSAEEEDEGFGEEEESEEATYTEIPAGEIGTNIQPKLCLDCHNHDSPTYKPFCFYQRVAKIRHLNPLKPRSAEELAAMLVCGCGDDCKCDMECTPECPVPPKK